MTLLETNARRGLWATVVWAALLCYATFTHQPPYKTDFAAWARYVTTTEFLVEHLLGSIVGAGVGTLGFTALAIALTERGAQHLAAWALATTVLGNTLVIAVFGVAAFAQPAIGRAFLAGHADAAALYDDVNGVPLMITAASGMLLLSAGLVLGGVGVARSGLGPRLAGAAIAVGGPLFAIVGVIMADFVQSIGAALLAMGTAGTAWADRQRRQPPLHV
jgi:hypothetical protein